VLATDPYVADGRLVTLDCVLAESDILVLGAPHRAYRGLEVGGKDVVDVWGVLGEGIKL
jgi:UDP-N-acetyl-D-mannosaminuronic acid dehydrogenase